MRVSIARALATSPTLLLMDEPFAALDEMARDRLNEELLRLRAEQKWTAVFVTHSVTEAVFLSTRIVVLLPNPGRIHAILPGRFALATPGGVAHCARVRVARGPGVTHAAGDACPMKSRLITLANAAAVFAALLVIWQLILWIFHVPPYMLPSPWAVARSVGNRFPSLIAALSITMSEAGGGLWPASSSVWSSH